MENDKKRGNVWKINQINRENLGKQKEMVLKEETKQNHLKISGKRK